jgi:hypothetical protein
MRKSIHNPCYVTQVSNVVTEAAIISHEDWKRIKKDSIHLTAEKHPVIARRHEIAWQLTVLEIQTKRSALISPDLSPDTTLRTQPRRSK